METAQSPSRSTPEPGVKRVLPQTPPYTPHVPKRRFDRADSPASVTSIQPTETISPAKQAQQRSVQEDNVKVEELTEADAGYMTDIDVVYPEELEEAESDSYTDDDSSENESDTGITQHFSRLDCVDGAEMEFERKRRAKHVRKRTDSRVFKRSHSTSIKSEAEMTDSDAMGDQDRGSSARRLRRRTQGPNGVKVVYNEASEGSPRSRYHAASADMHNSVQDVMEGDVDTDTFSGAEAMDVDESN